MDSTKFVKRTALGGYKEVDGGNSDPECTHVILPRDEYHTLLLEIKKAEQETRETKYEAEKRLKELRNSTEYQYRKAISETLENVRALEQELAEARAESDYRRRLNENLLRISRERANAERKLRPKKEHTGYVVVSSTEKDYRYRIDRRATETVTLWETVIQSPYTVEFTEEQARTQMRELTAAGEDGKRLIERLGIEYVYGDTYETMLKDPEWRNHDGYNIMLDRRLKANYRTGYWELIFLHTLPLDVVPKDMRAGGQDR